MTLDEALRAVRTKQRATLVSAVAAWRTPETILVELYQALCSAPAEQVRGFYFEATDNRVVVGRSDAVLVDGDEALGIPAQCGPLQIGSWRVEKGQLCFYFWGSDCRAYRVDTVAAALMIVAEMVLQQAEAQ